MEAEFFIEMPTRTGEKFKGHDLYNSGDQQLRWSAHFPLPSIGARIFITMNSIGWANVEGYFREEGFVGVMTKAENPPQWLREQRLREATSPNYQTHEWLRRGIGCQFGAEIALEQPAPRLIKTA
jgi:hypothetical protein